MTWSAADVKLLRKWRAEGFSTSQIAGKFDGRHSRGAVIRLCTALQLKSPHNKIKKTEWASASTVKQVVISTERNCTFMQLQYGMCKWPINDGIPDFFFCGDEAVLGRSYCEGHCRAAYSRAAS